MPTELQLVSQWLAQPWVSGGASILALLLAVLSYLRIRTIRRNLKRDREFFHRMLSPYEVYFHLMQALQYIELSIGGPRPRKLSEPQILPVYKGLRDSKRTLELFFELVHGTRLTGALALLQGARHYRKLGLIDQAVIHYEKAIEYASDSSDLTHADLCDCYCGLQRCYLALWGVEEAIHVARSAADRGVIACIPEAKIRKLFFVLCTAAFFDLTRVKIVSLVSPRGGLRTLTKV